MGSFEYDATGVDADSKGTSKVLPKRWFDLKIIEFTSKAGDQYPKVGRTKNNDPMVNILCTVINDSEFNGERVFHTVTFLPAKKADGTPTPGAGMSVHFLKTIGQPFEGKIKPNPDAWVGAEFAGYVIQDEYKGRIKNKIGEIKSLVAEGSSQGDSIPF